MILASVEPIFSEDMPPLQVKYIYKGESMIKTTETKLYFERESSL